MDKLGIPMNGPLLFLIAWLGFSFLCFVIGWLLFATTSSTKSKNKPSENFSEPSPERLALEKMTAELRGQSEKISRVENELRNLKMEEESLRDQLSKSSAKAEDGIDMLQEMISKINLMKPELPLPPLALHAHVETIPDSTSLIGGAKVSLASLTHPTHETPASAESAEPMKQETVAAPPTTEPTAAGETKPASSTIPGTADILALMKKKPS